MKKGIALILIGAIVLAGLFAGGSSESAGAQSAQGTFAHIFEPGHTLFKMSESFAQQVEQATDGRVKFRIVPAGALGGMDSNLEALSLGSVDITLVGESYTSRYYPPMGVTAAPYAFQNWDHFRSYVESPLYEEMCVGYTDATGNVIVGTYTSGFRSVTANKAVRTPADMVGLKIRVPDAPAFTAMPRAAGASPTPIAFGEVYLALQQKVVDAQENPLETTYNMKFFEVTKYICLTEHMMEPAHIIISANFWNKLSDQDKQIVLDIGKKVSAVATDEAQQASDELVSTFESLGNTVIADVDKAAFTAVTLPFNTSTEREWTPEQYQRLQALSK